jgi:O-antigen ligase
MARVQWPLALAAATLPSLLAFNVSPSPTFLNQALAFLCWGLFAFATITAQDRTSLRWRDLRPAAGVAVVLLVMIVAALWSWLGAALPSSLALSAMGTLIAALVLMACGGAAARDETAAAIFAAFCAGWVLAGVLNSAIAIVQVFAPAWPDGDWIARSGVPGRAVGNLRQPNHLSSLLLWSTMALACLMQMRRLGRRTTMALMVLLVFGVVLTASRTGVIGVLLLTAWGLLDKRLARDVRVLLVCTPLIYAAGWFVTSEWAAMAHATFGGEKRLAEADLSASRFRIWSDTLALIRANPWFGVGFGEFNFAWSLSEMPHRPVAFFDHTHNLPLQLVVELGLPLGLALTALLIWSLWHAARRGLQTSGDAGVAARCACMMLLLIGLHSQLEYPLWYSYFLLPAAWLFGFALCAAPRQQPAGAAAKGRYAAIVPRAVLAVASLAVTFGALVAVADYARVVAIFSAAENASPLAQRIEQGRRSVLFSHHADYAAGTMAVEPARALAAFDQASHYLLDTRLMTAWAQAFADSGDTERARHIAARLREFRNPASVPFFEPCDALEGVSTTESAAATPKPFQCVAPSAKLGWREFLAR